MYMEVHQLKKQGFGVAAIARKCGLSRTTVYRYLEKDFSEVVEWVEELQTRQRKLDPYRAHILGWLQEHPDLSASQISDWLEERYQVQSVGDSTVRSYVKELREHYHLPKTTIKRVYEAIPELPPGKQLQVDFGEITVRTTEKKKKKVYVIAFVLSHSRMKYAEWLDRPFTTQEVLRTHENAFAFYGGLPEEIVYDQDKLMTVSENSGDLILTEAFQAYKEQRRFRVYLCRKADPESKGKVENVVKFLKHNFAKHPLFHRLPDWNEQCLRWLDRKGNYQVHHTIKKRPFEVFALEKPHLQKISRLLGFEEQHASSITRTVHKDNIIKYRSNRYSVPLGTYQPGGANEVFLTIEKDQLLIRQEAKGDLLAVHTIAEGKGVLVKNPHHARDRSLGIPAYKQTIRQSFSKEEDISLFLKELSTRYPRYIRDQLHVLWESIQRYEEVAEEALKRCMQENLWSANAFRDVATYLSRQNGCSPNPIEEKQEFLPLEEASEQARQEKAAVRELDEYLHILGGHV
jgi:transposase